MGKVRPGNKQNSFLNREWAKHGRPFGKRKASSKRRTIDKELVRLLLEEV